MNSGEKEILQKMKEILENSILNRKIEADSILNLRLKEDLGLDSILMVNLQICIEDEFDIRFNPLEDDLVQIFSTVDNLLKFLRLKLGE